MTAALCKLRCSNNDADEDVRVASSGDDADLFIVEACPKRTLERARKICKISDILKSFTLNNPTSPFSIGYA